MATIVFDEVVVLALLHFPLHAIIILRPLRGLTSSPFGCRIWMNTVWIETRRVVVVAVEAHEAMLARDYVTLNRAIAHLGIKP